MKKTDPIKDLLGLKGSGEGCPELNLQQVKIFLNPLVVGITE
jgi:hypothetical protein